MTREEKWAFVATRKLPGVGRSLPFEETARRVERIARVVPITRITDLTSLDFLGLPVVAATTPLARDLKVHMGKGETIAAARASAMMEAVERVSGEDIDSDVVVVGSYDDLARRHGEAVIDPRRFDLAPRSTYRPDVSIRWVRGHDLLSAQPAYVARDLVVTVPEDGVLLHVNTNGLASGNSLLEASVHGICEVIERDAIGQREFLEYYGQGRDRQRPQTRVRLSTLPDVLQPWVKKILDNGLELVIDDVSSDLGVPTFHASIVDVAFTGGLEANGATMFSGYGTDLDASVAVRRALTEVVQARVGTIQGGRDSFNHGAPPGARLWPTSSTRETFRPVSGVAFSSLPTFPSPDILADLETLLSKLRTAGADRCVVVDMTRRELAIPVARVCIPGLSSFIVNKERVGWRCLRHLI